MALLCVVLEEAVSELWGTLRVLRSYFRASLQDTLSTANAVLDSAFSDAQAAADQLDSVTGRPVARQAHEHSQSAWSDFRTINCLVPAAMALALQDQGTSRSGAKSRWRAPVLTSFGDSPIADWTSWSDDLHTRTHPP